MDFRHKKRLEMEHKITFNKIILNNLAIIHIIH